MAMASRARAIGSEGSAAGCMAEASLAWSLARDRESCSPTRESASWRSAISLGSTWA